jgi:hypothetical protein
VDDLIKDIQAKTGLSAEKVLEVVTMVADYMKSALPEDLVAQVTEYLGGAAAAPGDAAAGAVASATDFATKAADTTAAAVGTVMGAVSDMMSSNDKS